MDSISPTALRRPAPGQFQACLSRTALCRSAVAGRYNLNDFPSDARFPRERQTIATHSVDLTAAGGVILRRPAGAVTEVVVCGRSAVSLWALPKGKPDAGEPAEATARREVQEETGLEVDVGPLVGEVRYSFYRPNDGALCNKVVRFFLMSPTGGDLARHDGEFDQVLWLPSEDAKTLLTYENEARILEKALAMAKDAAA